MLLSSPAEHGSSLLVIEFGLTAIFVALSFVLPTAWLVMVRSHRALVYATGTKRACGGYFCRIFCPSVTARTAPPFSRPASVYP